MIGLKLLAPRCSRVLRSGRPFGAEDEEYRGLDRLDMASGCVYECCGPTDSCGECNGITIVAPMCSSSHLRSLFNLFAPANRINQSRCLATTLPAFECGIQEPCFCNNNDLSRTFSACISSGCATLEDRLGELRERSHSRSSTNTLRRNATLSRRDLQQPLTRQKHTHTGRCLGVIWLDHAVPCIPNPVPISAAPWQRLQLGRLRGAPLLCHAGTSERQSGVRDSIWTRKGCLQIKYQSNFGPIACELTDIWYLRPTTNIIG